MERALKFVAWSLPLVFAFAFLVPVIDQGMQALGLAAPMGLTTLTFALVIGAAWGLIAQLRGRWI
jgi:ABC-type transport system involved in cytochrome c biogenesis permease subunit